MRLIQKQKTRIRHELEPIDPLPEPVPVLDVSKTLDDIEQVLDGVQDA